MEAINNGICLCASIILINSIQESERLCSKHISQEHNELNYYYDYLYPAHGHILFLLCGNLLFTLIYFYCAVWWIASCAPRLVHVNGAILLRERDTNKAFHHNTSIVKINFGRIVHGQVGDVWCGELLCYHYRGRDHGSMMVERVQVWLAFVFV